jgi:hypothetical protein
MVTPPTTPSGRHDYSVQKAVKKYVWPPGQEHISMYPEKTYSDVPYLPQTLCTSAGSLSRTICDTVAGTT